MGAPSPMFDFYPAAGAGDRIGKASASSWSSSSASSLQSASRSPYPSASWPEPLARAQSIRRRKARRSCPRTPPPTRCKYILTATHCGLERPRGGRVARQPSSKLSKGIPGAVPPVRRFGCRSRSRGLPTRGPYLLRPAGRLGLK